MHRNDVDDSESNIKVAVILNIVFTIIEIVGGFWTNSLAILSDALHDLGDSIALVISWVAERKSKKPADLRRTYGYLRLSLFSALFAGIVLVAGSLFILSEAIPRLFRPEDINAPGMIGIAVIGIVFNGLGMLRLKKGRSQNEKVLSWHFMEDVLGWVLILIGAIIMYFWDYPVIDPIMTVGLTVFILWGVFRNLRGTLNIFMQGVPEHIDVKELKGSLVKIKGVIDVHDIHIWSLEGKTDIFTGHVVVSEDQFKRPDRIVKRIKRVLKENQIDHSTVELETVEFCSGIECKNDYRRSRSSVNE